MNHLILVRHGEAEAQSIAGRDAARNLTRYGRDSLHRAATWLASSEPKPGRIIASPYLRAQQTAKIVATAFGMADVIETDERLTPHSNFRLLFDIIEEMADVDSLIMISHNPLVSLAAVALCSNGGMRLQYPPGAFCKIQLQRSRQPAGILDWFVTPACFDGQSHSGNG